MPQTIYRGCARTELRYDTGYALQSQVLNHVQYRGAHIFSVRVVQYWTPHTGRNFVRSATTALGQSKEDRDIMGGWWAQGSDRYSRVAK